MNFTEPMRSEPSHSKSQEKIKQRVLTQAEPSVTAGLAEAQVIKDQNFFLLTEPSGCIPVDEPHGYGLYFEDMRYLDGYQLKMNDKPLTVLATSSQSGTSCVHQLTNPRICSNSSKTIENQKLSIQIFRKVDGRRLCLEEKVRLTNFQIEDLEVELEWHFRMNFEDVFVIRGLWDEQPGEMGKPTWIDNDLYAEYKGIDGLNRGLTIRLDEKMQKAGPCSVKAKVTVPKEGTVELTILYLVKKAKGDCHRDSTARADNYQPNGNADGFSFRPEMSVESDDLLVNHAIKESFADLEMLRSHLHGDSYIAAGLPWFGTLFGRDSVITAMQMLPYDYRLAKETLRLLARYQGQKVDTFTDEQPGKILHEMRIGELAKAGKIPHTPFYGTVDATPLFLILIGCYCRWSADLQFFHEMRHAVEAGLKWMSEFGDTNRDGFLDYRSSTQNGLVNQGWKDAGNSILNSQGKVAKPPITLVEFQGYAYRAKLELADLYERVGEPEKAAKLTKEAKELKERFQAKFWLEEEDTFAMGLDGDGKLLDVVSSNPTHCMWAEMLDKKYVERMKDRYFRKDIHSGWGIRTLSSKEKGYNPVGYHLGTVWPHDNGFFASGLKRYGYKVEARKIFDALLKATLSFENQRLPELFSGFSRDTFDSPVPYPVACHPQAWAAGTLPSILMDLLGVRADGYNRKIQIIDPILPTGVTHLKVDGLQVAGDSICLEFKQAGEEVQVRQIGDSRIEVEIGS